MDYNKKITENRDIENNKENAKQCILSLLKKVKLIFLTESGDYDISKILLYIKNFISEHWIFQVFTVILIILAIIIKEKEDINSKLGEYNKDHEIQSKVVQTKQKKNRERITAYEFLQLAYKTEQSHLKNEQENTMKKKQEITELNRTEGNMIVANL